MSSERVRRIGFDSALIAHGQANSDYSIARPMMIAYGSSVCYCRSSPRMVTEGLIDRHDVLSVTIFLISFSGPAVVRSRARPANTAKRARCSASTSTSVTCTHTRAPHSPIPLCPRTRARTGEQSAHSGRARQPSQHPHQRLCPRL